jgi:hypothetical protein
LRFGIVGVAVLVRFGMVPTGRVARGWWARETGVCPCT